MIGKSLKYRKYFDWTRIAEIENYQEAISSPDLWVLHHRMEIQPDGVILSIQWMIDHDIYFNQDPCMLIFMRSIDHKKLHSLNKTEEMKAKEKWTPERLAKLRETLSKPEVKAKIYTPARNEKIRQWHIGKPFPGSK